MKMQAYRFVFRTKYYDIALLKLKRPAMMNNYVNTVCVPGENETIPVGSTCFMTGKNTQLLNTFNTFIPSKTNFLLC